MADITVQLDHESPARLVHYPWSCISVMLL